jgi:hypothetical protein
MADTRTDRLKVFISYSRKDSAAFADELVLGLEDRGFAPFLDRHDIKPGEPWEARLRALIEQSDTVVFVISPASVKSERCVWEVNQALGLSKRLLPVIYKPVPERDIPAKLSDLQFVRFDTAPGMMRPLRELAEALRVDLEWMREHTRLGELAARWQSRNRSEFLLLRDDDLVAAKAWAAKRQPDAPEITELQRSFLKSSEQADLARAAESKAARRRTRLARFLKGAGGLLLLVIATLLLYWDEMREVSTARALDEGARLVLEADPSRIDPANEGELVHVSGELKTTARLTDPDFAMSAAGAALLVRDSEMYKLVEERSKDSTNYVPRWSAERAEPFRLAANPPLRFPSINVAAHDATLGAFRPGKKVLEKLPATLNLPIELATVEAARTHVDGPVQLIDGKLYLGSDPAQPHIGDIRISWRIAKTGPVSLMGRQAGTDLVEFQTSGDSLLLARSGMLSAVEMLKIKGQENSIRTWFTRLGGGFFVIFGCWLLLGRLLPALLFGGLIGLTAVAGAWLDYRTFEAAIALTVIAAAATFAVIRGWLPGFALAVQAGYSMIPKSGNRFSEKDHAQTKR